MNTIRDVLSLDNYADNLYSVSIDLKNNRLKYYQLQAKKVDADHFYCLKSELEEEKIPIVYVYDFRKKNHREYDLAKINRKIWTIGDIALAIVIYADEIFIIDTRKPVQINSNGELKANILQTVSEIDEKLKDKIFTGRFLEDKEIDYLSISPYVKLLEHIDRKILSKKDYISCSPETLRAFIVKCILIKYLEEQRDENGENIFKNNFFSSFVNSKVNATFCDVLHSGDVPSLFKELNKKFNGGIFDLTSKEVKEILNSNLHPISIALDGRFEEDGQGSFWRLYDLKFIPIEFISRLYERFILSVEGRQKKDGAYYTPPHLARLLINEVLPFDTEIDFDNFKILDPSCGSGIFLVLAYKRLITLWMLQNNKTKINGEKDIEELKKILTNCIYGIDINADAISITATSLQIEYTSHFNPKDIDLIQFDDLVEKGNLNNIGFFKFYKETNLQYNIIVGNPPFNIDKDENKKNAKEGLDDICDNEKFVTIKGKNNSFPYKNPALTIFYKSLDKLLLPFGYIFMIMPSSAFLYNPTSHEFRKALFSRWKTIKIYDFTPLKGFLWGDTKIATVAVLLNKSESDKNSIEHLIIRSSLFNHKGALRFQIDKYDRYQVPFKDAITNKYYWKTNLLGGGRLHLYVNKYLAPKYTIEVFIQTRKWIANVGFQRDRSSKKNLVNLKNKDLVISEKFQNDLSYDIYDICNKDDIVRANNRREIYSAPNILLRLNTNYDIPILLNYKDAFFPKGILGIKGDELEVMKKFVQVFKINKPIYKQLISIISSKVFVQQTGRYSIDAQDIMNLPLVVNSDDDPIPFEDTGEMEKAVWNDAELLAQCMNKSSGILFQKTIKDDIDLYSASFCKVLNYIYENGSYIFRPIRIIIDENWVWITFCHSNKEQPIETSLLDNNKIIYNHIIKDDISNNGLRINRVITYVHEPNCISFLKPRILKYWTQSIAFRDAEEIKGLMFKSGY